MNLGFPDPVLIGLATTAHNNAAPATLAEYRDVYIPRTPVILVRPVARIANSAGERFSVIFSRRVQSTE